MLSLALTMQTAPLAKSTVWCKNSQYPGELISTSAGPPPPNAPELLECITDSTDSMVARYVSERYMRYTLTPLVADLVRGGVAMGQRVGEGAR